MTGILAELEASLARELAEQVEDAHNALRRRLKEQVMEACSHNVDFKALNAAIDDLRPAVEARVRRCFLGKLSASLVEVTLPQT